MRFLAIVLFTGCLVAGAGESSKSKEDSADLGRSCKNTYSSCVAACGSSDKKACASECQSDCEVCAIDVGEEPADICSK